MLHEGSLQRVKRSVVRKSLYGKNLFSRDILDRVSAGSDRFIVDDDGAYTALALAAAELGAGQFQVRAQHPEEIALAVRGYAYGTVVELETNGLIHRCSSFPASGVLLA
jgi:hypothetical protein